MSSVAIVLGTYNRLALLKDAIESIRASAGRNGNVYAIIVIDGGSTDGTREWMQSSSNQDIWTIYQELPLTGAVRAFNLGFERAVNAGFDYVAHLNDDIKILTLNAIDIAIEKLNADPKLGAVAFGYDLYKPGTFLCSQYGGKTYVNFGVIRREAGMAVARAQGDPTGCAWWNPVYRTYGADTEFGCQLAVLGWEVLAMPELHVRDLNAQDDLRKLNVGDFADSRLFYERWHNRSLDAFGSRDHTLIGEEIKA